MQQKTEQQRKLQIQSTIPRFNWPTSKPGPQVTPPPPGQKPLPGRTEQMVEIGYNQEMGTPSTEHPLRTMPDDSLKGRTAFDQQQTAQEALKKRRK